MTYLELDDVEDITFLLIKQKNHFIYNELHCMYSTKKDVEKIRDDEDRNKIFDINSNEPNSGLHPVYHKP